MLTFSTRGVPHHTCSDLAYLALLRPRKLGQGHANLSRLCHAPMLCPYKGSILATVGDQRVAILRLIIGTVTVL